MIIVNLKGGLGNQMFQYALGRHLALKNKDILKLNTQNLTTAKEQGNIYRPFDLESFCIYKEIAEVSEIEKVQYPYGTFSKINSLIRRKVFKRYNIIFDKKFLNLSGNIYLDGYWQSPNYFDSIRKTLLEDFKLNDGLSASGKIIEDSIKSTNSVSLHVRRGDYVQNSRVLDEYGICSVSYYERALSEIAKLYSDYTVYVFSDDIEWVKNNLQFKNSSVVFIKDESITSAQELYLMSKCKHNIIANSTFSWWGAWLNNNPDKIVIAPTPWFDKVIYDKNLIPSSWKQIPK